MVFRAPRRVWAYALLAASPILVLSMYLILALWLELVFVGFLLAAGVILLVIRIDRRVRRSSVEVASDRVVITNHAGRRHILLAEIVGLEDVGDSWGRQRLILGSGESIRLDPVIEDYREMTGSIRDRLHVWKLAHPSN